MRCITGDKRLLINEDGDVYMRLLLLCTAETDPREASRVLLYQVPGIKQALSSRRKHATPSVYYLALKLNGLSGLGKKKKKENLTSWFALKRPKTTSKKQAKKKKFLFGSYFFFRRIPDYFFLWPPRQSIPLGRIRGGRAPQKVDQAKSGARTRP